MSLLDRTKTLRTKERQTISEIFLNLITERSQARRLFDKMEQAEFVQTEQKKPINPFLEERNRAMVLLEAQETRRIKDLESLIDESGKLLAKYRKFKSDYAKVQTAKGELKSIEDLSPEEIITRLTQAVKKKTRGRKEPQEMVLRDVAKNLEEEMNRFIEKLHEKNVIYGALTTAIEEDRKISDRMKLSMKSSFSLPKGLGYRLKEVMDAAREEVPKAKTAADKDLEKKKSGSKDKIISREKFSEPVPLAMGQFGVVSTSIIKFGKKIKIALKSCKDPRNEVHMEREYDLCSRLKGIPGLATAFDKLVSGKPEEFFGFAEKTLFLVYKYIVGRNPVEYFGSLSISPEKKHKLIIKMMQSLMGSVDKIHNKGLVHRDIKPENIKLTNRGRTVLLDFGEIIEKGVKDEKVSGSPTYMPPESLSGNYRVDVGQDIYAIGITLYELFTGDSNPFKAKGITDRDEAIMAAISGKSTVNQVYRNNIFSDSALKAQGVPRKIRKIIAKATRYDPRMRYKSIKEMLADLSGKDKDDEKESTPFFGVAPRRRKKKRPVNKKPSGKD